MTNLVSRVVLPIGIILVAVGCAAAMIVLRPSAERKAPAVQITRVEVVVVVPQDAVARIEATGVVQPARQISVIPEVSGRIVWQNDALIPGGRLKKGDVLAQVDAREYKLRVDQARTAVEAASLELELEKGRQRVAEREWALLGEGRAAEEAPLAMRKPQMAVAQQSLAGSESSVAQAQLSLQRTMLFAPFNALILDESIEIGQVVTPGMPVATLVGSDEMWVKVSIPVEKLPALVFPTGDTPGAPATVVQRLGQGVDIERTGHVTQLLAQLDPQTRTAQILVTILDPIGDSGLPLLPGAYVDVGIAGRVMPNTITLPRTALDGGNAVWVVDTEERLSKRQIQIGWREADNVIVTSGLEAGARVVTSPLALPIEGMQVQITASPADAAAM